MKKFFCIISLVTAFIMMVGCHSVPVTFQDGHKITGQMPRAGSVVVVRYTHQYIGFQEMYWSHRTCDERKVNGAISYSVRIDGGNFVGIKDYGTYIVEDDLKGGILFRRINL